MKTNHDNLVEQKKNSSTDWISTKDALPKEGEPVLIHITDEVTWERDKYQDAKIEFGISIEQRKKMAAGELGDTLIGVVDGTNGHHRVRRSRLTCRCDETEHNKLPYVWIIRHGLIHSQDVDYWMPRQNIPKAPSDKS
jgi:hypothetical protein